jgi:hypothetical protein
MEDPIDFDVYVRLPAGMTQEAADLFELEKSCASRLEALKCANASIQQGTHVRLMRRVGWAHANSAATIAPWLQDIIVCQAGYAPNDKHAYCPKHALRYGGIRGCHVCSGFYLP